MCEIGKSDSRAGLPLHQTASSAPWSAYFRSLCPYGKGGEVEWSYILQNVVALVRIKWAGEEEKPKREQKEPKGGCE